MTNENGTPDPLCFAPRKSGFRQTWPLRLPDWIVIVIVIITITIDQNMLFVYICICIYIYIYMICNNNINNNHNKHNNYKKKKKKKMCLALSARCQARHPRRTWAVASTMFASARYHYSILSYIIISVTCRIWLHLVTYYLWFVYIYVYMYIYMYCVIIIIYIYCMTFASGRYHLFYDVRFRTLAFIIVYAQSAY